MRGTASFDYFAWKSVRGPWLWGVGRPHPQKPSKHFWCAISRIRGKETPWGIDTKCCLWVGIQDLITCATFGDDRLRGLGVAVGRISHFSIDSRHRPYNSRATGRVCDRTWTAYTCSLCDSLIIRLRVNHTCHRPSHLTYILARPI